MTDCRKLRQALIEALPVETSVHAAPPEPTTLYLPMAHIKALRLESNLVVGARGVGKSFWTEALRSTELRALLGNSVRELDRTDVRVGFSIAENIDAYPNADSFSQLMQQGVDPYDIWRAVVVRWLASYLGEAVPVNAWLETVVWFRNHPEDAARLMSRANATIAAANRFGLIVFDALDRTSNDWRQMDDIVRGLLRATLWLKSYPRLQAKVFLREDQFQRTVLNFPDASKLLNTRAELTWARHDLHGLLWQRLINAAGESGRVLRGLYRQLTPCNPGDSDGPYQLIDEAKRETPLQRALFEALAGPWMGKDKRRGVPYTWAVSHLADGRGQTSPRSFLAAIRQAAEDSQIRYDDFPFALHYESIKRGIQKASENRVIEVAEDDPWVRSFLETLRGLNVPCEFSAIREQWQAHFPSGPDSVATADRLPAQHAERGWEGIRDDLQRLGLIELKKDGRIDMPDLYRVGFGLGRKGGVKPGL